MKDDVEGLRKTLKILHMLAELGVVEQFLDADGFIRWRAVGHPKRWETIKRALRM